MAPHNNQNGKRDGNGDRGGHNNGRKPADEKRVKKTSSASKALVKSKPDNSFVKGVDKIDIKRPHHDQGNRLCVEGVNSPYGGGAQVNTRAPLPGGGAVLVVDPRNAGAAVGREARRIAAEQRVPSVVVQVMPNNPARYRNLVRGNRALLETVEKFGAISSTILVVKKTAVVEEVDDEVDDDDMVDVTNDCPACGRQNHQIKDCVYPEIDGKVHGCTICNTTDHNVDACGKWAKLLPLEKMEILVQQRGRMPCLATDSVDWVGMAHDYFVKDPGAPRYQDFPWTPAFGTFVYNNESTNRHLWQYYIKFDRKVLPADPDTRDFSHFMRTAKTAAANLGVLPFPSSSFWGKQPGTNNLGFGHGQ